MKNLIELIKNIHLCDYKIIIQTNKLFIDKLNNKNQYCKYVCSRCGKIKYKWNPIDDIRFHQLKKEKDNVILHRIKPAFGNTKLYIDERMNLYKYDNNREGLVKLK